VSVLKSRAKLNSGELLRFCQERPSAYLAPKSVDFAESPPHMEAGKVIKVQVREMFLRR